VRASSRSPVRIEDHLTIVASSGDRPPPHPLEEVIRCVPLEQNYIATLEKGSVLIDHNKADVRPRAPRARSGWLVLESGSVSYGKATACLPLVDLLRAYFRIETRDDTRAIRAKATGNLLALDEGLQDSVAGALWLLDARYLFPLAPKKPEESASVQGPAEAHQQRV
jgi:hypothetical protein